MQTPLKGDTSFMWLPGVLVTDSCFTDDWCGTVRFKQLLNVQILTTRQCITFLSNFASSGFILLRSRSTDQINVKRPRKNALPSQIDGKHQQQTKQASRVCLSCVQLHCQVSPRVLGDFLFESARFLQRQRAVETFCVVALVKRLAWQENGSLRAASAQVRKPARRPIRSG